MRRLALTAVVIAASACSKGENAATRSASDKVEVGQPAPAYAATSLNGDSVSLAKMRGKVVLMNVWATWCGPCRKEIPELRAIHSAYKDKGLELVGVSVDADGSDQAIREFLKEFRMDYAIWRDPNEGVSATFRMAGVPATFLIDRKGVLRWKATGAIEPGDSSLTRAIQAALATP
jgi:cytochrome c biogenesis protein CcmG, thiol:disulfide interchange protein DsbE